MPAHLTPPATDLFGDPVRAPATLLELEGQLSEDAQVRLHPSDHGRARPVLHLHLTNVGPGLHQVHVEKPFDDAHRFTADAMALRLKRGMRVRIAASFLGACLTLPHTETITALPSTPPHPSHP